MHRELFIKGTKVLFSASQNFQVKNKANIFPSQICMKEKQILTREIYREKST